MKKYLTTILLASIIASLCSVTAGAEEKNAAVYVTIADGNGNLVITQETIVAKDNNNDGKITIDEALYETHEVAFDGGAEAGYLAYDSEYGRSLGMLWGDDCGVYGYYVNNTSAMSLDDEVKEGDYINAFCYSDLETWSDTYCFFDKNTAEGNEITLTLSAASWDENYNPITVPVENATITLNGEKTAFVTDAEGKVTITADGTGKYVISAVTDTQTLVPPVCIADITADTQADSVVSSNPSTSVSLSVTALITTVAAVLISRKRK